MSLFQGSAREACEEHTRREGWKVSAGFWWKRWLLWLCKGAVLKMFEFYVSLRPWWRKWILLAAPHPIFWSAWPGGIPSLPLVFRAPL